MVCQAKETASEASSASPQLVLGEGKSDIQTTECDAMQCGSNVAAGKSEKKMERGSGDGRRRTIERKEGVREEEGTTEEEEEGRGNRERRSRDEKKRKGGQADQC